MTKFIFALHGLSNEKLELKDGSAISSGIFPDKKPDLKKSWQFIRSLKNGGEEKCLISLAKW